MCTGDNLFAEPPDYFRRIVADGGNLEHVNAHRSDLSNLFSTFARRTNDGKPVRQVVGNAQFVGKRGVSRVTYLLVLGGYVFTCIAMSDSCNSSGTCLPSSVKRKA